MASVAEAERNATREERATRTRKTLTINVKHTRWIHLLARVYICTSAKELKTSQHPMQENRPFQSSAIRSRSINEARMQRQSRSDTVV
jgi:hypothetical protein